MIKPLTVSEAQAELDAAIARLSALREEVDKAEQARDRARYALRDARVNADADLPRATLVTTNWRGSKPERQEVVIVKRTAKRITVRLPGFDHCYTFRMGWSDVWREYPAPKGWNSLTRTLEVPS